MGRVVPFRRPRRELWRPSLARRRRAAKVRSPFIVLYLLVAVAGLVWFAAEHVPGLKDEIALVLENDRVDICGHFGGSTCVIDGDTIEHRGQRIRLADINTPEIGDYKCDAELRMGLLARRRLIELLNEGSFEIVATGGRDRDIYGRQLRIVERHGVSLGDQLVAEGLAHRWSGYRQGWCG
jgi:micrococcal nuclease